MKSPPAPPMRLGKRKREEPETRHAGDQLVGEVAGLVVVRRARRDLRLGKVANGVADLPLLVAEIEVHCV